MREKRKLNTSSIDALNRLFLIHRFSLATYLRGSHEYTHSGDEQAVKALHQIADDHDDCTKRVARLLDDAVGSVPHSSFPMEFTDHDDIALDYLLPELARHEQQMVDCINQVKADLVAPESELQTLVASMLAKKQNHIERLTSVQKALSATGESPN